MDLFIDQCSDEKEVRIVNRLCDAGYDPAEILEVFATWTARKRGWRCVPRHWQRAILKVINEL